jgi:pre-mRNA-splicing factor ATP-dependent RNA helicase DHX15/PRP43
MKTNFYLYRFIISIKMEKVGILDPGGENLNPLTGEDYSSSYSFFSNIWSKLPMYTQISPESIIQKIIDHQVVILESGTGSGKSVLMPKYALHSLGYEGKVVITNPKQTPSKGNADFAAKCLDVKLGKEVGYQFKGSVLEDGSKSKSKYTKLLFSTDGSVVEVLRKDPTGKAYDIVIIDEAHERNLRIDLLLLQMKTALRINPNIKLIVMSATLPGNLFYDYYKEFKIVDIKVSGKSNKPVELFYLERPISQMRAMEEGVDLIVNEIIKKKKEGDIIMFVTSYNEAKKAVDKLENKINKAGLEKAFCVAMSAQVKDPEVIELATEENLYRELPGGPWNRKIVVGTNQLESSITIDGIVYVVDNGLEYSIAYDPNTMSEKGGKSRISTSQARQRTGRAGRTKPGECYRLYTEEEYNKMSRDPVLDIKKSRLDGDILDAFNIEGNHTLSDVRDYFCKYIEPPPEKFTDSGFRVLYALKLITGLNETSVLTELGQKVLMVNKAVGFDVSMATCLVSSLDYDCHFETCAIFSMINNMRSMDDMFTFDKTLDDPKEFKRSKKQFETDGDIFSMLKIYTKFYREIKKKSVSWLKEYCYENFLSYRFLTNVRRDHIRMFRDTEFMKDYAETGVKKYGLYGNLLISLFSGYYINLCHKDGKKYTNWFPKKKSSGVPQDYFLPGTKNYMFYIKLMSSMGKTEFSISTGVAKSQIDALSKNFGYSVSFPEGRKEKKSVEKKKHKGPDKRGGIDKRRAKSIKKMEKGKRKKGK